MSETTKIYCEAGHHWNRPKQRGKRPKFCPKHQPVVEPKSDTQTLTCKAGHTWERPSQRGKKPIWCPEHKPVAEEKAKAGRSVAARFSLDSLLARFPNMDYESKLKFEYIEREFARGRETEDGDKDLAMLAETQKQLVKRLERESNRQAHVELEEVEVNERQDS